MTTNSNLATVNDARNQIAVVKAASILEKPDAATALVEMLLQIIDEQHDRILRLEILVVG